MKPPPLRPPLSVRLLRLLATCLNATGLACPWLIGREGFVQLLGWFFGRMAPRYDHLVAQTAAASERAHPLDAALAGRTLAGLSPRLIADLGAGTGAASFRLAARFPAARVVAADLSLPMLRELRKKARERGLGGRVYPVAADTRQLPFRAETFGLVVSMNAPPFLGEMGRVAKPGAFVITAVYLCTFSQQVARLARWRLRREGFADPWAEGVGLGFALRGRKGA